MQFETDQMIRAFLRKQPGQNETYVVRCGMITSHATVFRSVWGSMLSWSNYMPNIAVEEVSAAMIHGTIHGFQAETITNDDLKEVGQRALHRSRRGVLVTLDSSNITTTYTVCSVAVFCGNQLLQSL